MSRADEQAWKLFPVRKKINGKNGGSYDSNVPRRKACVQGYKQAIADIVKLIEHGEGFDIMADYGERCELVDAIKKLILKN